MSARAWAATAALVAGVLTAAAPPVARAQGCAMCRTAFDGQQADPLSAAFDVSTVFLMATPYTVVASVGVWFVLATRRRGRRAGGDEHEAEIPLV